MVELFSLCDGPRTSVEELHRKKESQEKVRGNRYEVKGLEFLDILMYVYVSIGTTEAINLKAWDPNYNKTKQNNQT